MTVSRIRVLIADDHTMVRQGLRSVLESYPNIEVIGEAENGERAVTLASKLQPTVVIMDICMSKMDGITATRLIKQQHAQMIVLGLSVDPKDYEIYAMQKAGAFDILKKDQAIHLLYAAIQRAVAAVQPVLILEETISPTPAPQDLDEGKQTSIEQEGIEKPNV